MSNSSAAAAAASMVVGPMMNLVFEASTGIGGAIAASSATGLLDTSAVLLYNTTLADRLVVAPPTTTSPKWNHPLLGVVLLTVTLITIFGNTLVICAVIRERSLKSVTNYYIVSLAVADLIVGLVVMPFNSLNKMTNDFWFFGDVWCDIWHSIDVCASTASINSLLFIALDRHSAISDPISYHTSWLTRYWLLFVALIWICSACISFPAIAYWRWITKEYVLYQCVFPDDIYYLVFSSLVSFYIPLSIMIIVYFRIYRAATRQINALKTGQKLNVKSSDGTALTLRIHRGGYHKVDTNMSESNTANNLASTNQTNANANHHSLSKTKTLTMSHINHHQQQSSSSSKNSPNKSSHRTHSLTVEAQSKALFHRSKPTNNMANKMPVIKSNSKEDILNLNTNQNTNIQLTTRPKLQPSIERRARLLNKTNKKRQRRSKSTGDLRLGEARSPTATTKRRVKSCHSNINTQKIKLNLSSLATLKLNNNINKKKNCSSSVRVKNTTTDNGNNNHHRFSPMTAQHRDASFSSMSSLFLSNRVKPINFLYYPTLISKSKSSKSQLDVDECQTTTNITAELTKHQPESTKSNPINNNNNNNNNNNEILSGNVDKPDQQRQQIQNMDNLYDLIIETNRSRSQSVDEENIFHENLAYLRQIVPNPVTNDPQAITCQKNSVTGRLSVVGSERVKRTNSQMVEPLESSLGRRVFSSIKNKLRKSSTAAVPKTTSAPQESSADTGLLDDQLLANISMKKLEFYRQHYIEHNNLAPKSAHSPVIENNDHDYQLSTMTTATNTNRNISRLKNFFSLRRKQTPRATTGRMRNDSMFSSIYSNNSSMPAVTYEFGNSKCRPGGAKMIGHEAMYNGAIRTNDAKAAAPKTTKNLIAKKVKGLSLTKKLSKFSREQKAAKTLGIVMGVFIICWLPFFIYNVITGIFKASLSSSHEFIYSVFTWFGYLNSGCNPIIYAFSSRDFRRAFYKILFPARFMRNKKKAFKRAAANYNNSLTTGATLQSQKMNACRLNSTSINNSQLNAHSHSQLEPHNSLSLRQPVVCVTCQTYENLVMSQIAQQKQSKSQAQFRAPQLNVPTSKVPEYSLIKCKITNRGTIPDEAKDVRLNLDELELIKLKLVRSPGDNQEPMIGEQTCPGLFAKSVGESVAVDESSNVQSTTPVRLAGKLRDEPHVYGKRHESMPANLPINNMKLTENKAASSSFSSSILVSPSRRPTKSIYGLARNIRRRLHGMLLNGAAGRRSTTATSSSNSHHNHNVSLNINNSHIKIVGMSKYRYNPSYYNTHVRRMSSSSLMSSISLNLMKNNSIPNNNNTANNAPNSAAVATTNSRDYTYVRKLTNECVKCQKPAPIVAPQQQQQQQQQPLSNSRSQSPSSVRSMSSTSINVVKKKNGMIAVGTKFVFNKPVANDSSTIKAPSNYNRCEFFSSYYDWKCADNNTNNNNNNLHETTYHLLNTTNCCNINDPAMANVDDLNYRNFSLYDDDDDDYLNQINSKIRKTQLSNGK